MNPFIVIVPLLFFLSFVGCNRIVMDDDFSNPNIAKTEPQSNRVI